MSTLIASIYNGKAGSVTTDGYSISVSSPRALHRARMSARKQRRKDRLGKVKGWFLTEVLERGQLATYTNRRTLIGTLEKNIEQFGEELSAARGKLAALRSDYDDQMVKVEAAREAKADDLNELRSILMKLSGDCAEVEKEVPEWDTRLKEAKQMLSSERRLRTKGHKRLAELVG